MTDETKDNVNQLIDNLRIDNADSSEIMIYRDAAKDFMASAIGGSKDDEFYQDNKRFDLAVQMLTDFYYKNKSATMSSNQSLTAFGVQTFILQLKPEYQFWKEAQDNGDSPNGTVE